jgi:hypothetical protein
MVKCFRAERVRAQGLAVVDRTASPVAALAIASVRHALIYST